MKLSKIIIMIALTSIFTNGYALETKDEKDQAATNELKRDVNKAVNRVQEAVCLESDTECLKQKAANRVDEATDAVKDKASEVKNKVDE